MSNGPSARGSKIRGAGQGTTTSRYTRGQEGVEDSQGRAQEQLESGTRRMSIEEGYSSDEVAR